MKNNITSISVYLDRRDRVADPETEEQAAKMRGYIAFKIRNFRRMGARDKFTLHRREERLNRQSSKR